MKYGQFSNTLGRGFTIVELLIVIVIIAVLAAIVIVAYNSIQQRANDTAVKNDLANFNKKIELFRVEKSTYPTSTVDLNSLEFKASKASYATPTGTTNLTYCWNSDGSKGMLVAQSKSNNVFYLWNGSVGEYPNSWNQSSSSSRCTSIDSSLSTQYNGFVAADGTTGPWRAWAGGN